MKLLDEYALGTTRHHMNRNLIELSNAGILRVARFAHDMVSWHFGLKEVIVAALEISKIERAACEGERVIPAPRLAFTRVLSWHELLRPHNRHQGLGVLLFSECCRATE